MLLRLSLIVAILAGAGALFFSQTSVKEKIETLTSERDNLTVEVATANAEKQTAQNEATQAKNELTSTKKDLSDKVTELATLEARFSEQFARAQKLAADLTQMTGERNEARDSLAQWTSFGRTPAQIQELVTGFGALREEKDVLVEENKILERTRRSLEGRLAVYEGDRDKEPEMPALKGKVLAVDPKYNFVVLDVGRNHGAVERGRLFVSREGRLVGAVRITRLEDDRSVANLIPELTQADIVEGDQVLH